MPKVLNRRKKRLMDSITNPSHVRNRDVLVINRNYQPIATVKVKDAVKKIFSENAVVVLPPGKDSDIWQEMAWEDWAELQPKDGESVLAAVRRVFKVPEIIKVSEYGGIPRRSVKLSRRAIYSRDSNTCQYCGKSAPNDVSYDDLSMDHVIPKSKGGKTTFDNVVIACTKCNRKKDNRTPDEAHMPLLNKPTMPPYDILKGRRIRVDSWQHFLGDCYWECPLQD